MGQLPVLTFCKNPKAVCSGIRIFFLCDYDQTLPVGRKMYWKSKFFYIVKQQTCIVLKHSNLPLSPPISGTPGGKQGLRNHSKLVNQSNWSNSAEPYGYITGFGLVKDPFTPSNHPLFRLWATQSWLIWNASELSQAIAPTVARRSRNSSLEVRLELTISKDYFRTMDLETFWSYYTDLGFFPEIDGTGLSDLYLALHMPSRAVGELVQPFASLDDTSVLLPRGYVYEIKANVKKYKQLSSKAHPCTHGVSLSAWQAAKNAWAYTLMNKLLDRSYGLSTATNEPIISELKNFCRPSWLTPVPLEKNVVSNRSMGEFL